MSNLDGLDKRLDKALTILEDHARRGRQDGQKLDTSLLSEMQQERLAQIANKVDLDIPRPFMRLSDGELDELHTLAEIVIGKGSMYEQFGRPGQTHD